MLIKIKSRDDELQESMFDAGAYAGAASAWIEVNRPLTVLSINRSIAQQLRSPTKPGDVLDIPVVDLPVGCDIKSVTCTPADINAGWLAMSLTFGTLNLVNPQGSENGVNLSAFHPLAPHEDKAAPWILSKTKVDVRVTAQLINGSFRHGRGPTRTKLAAAVEHEIARRAAHDAAAKAKTKLQKQKAQALLDAVPAKPLLASSGGVDAIFHGFSINAFQEEQVCAIQTRIEPTDRNVGCAQIIDHFRRATGDLTNRLLSRHANSRDPAASKVARVVAAGGSLVDAVKGLFAGDVPAPSSGHPSYVPPPAPFRADWMP